MTDWVKLLQRKLETAKRETRATESYYHVGLTHEETAGLINELRSCPACAGSLTWEKIGGTSTRVCKECQEQDLANERRIVELENWQAMVCELPTVEESAARTSVTRALASLAKTGDNGHRLAKDAMKHLDMALTKQTRLLMEEVERLQKALEDEGKMRESAVLGGLTYKRRLDKAEDLAEDITKQLEEWERRYEILNTPPIMGEYEADFARRIGQAPREETKDGDA